MAGIGLTGFIFPLGDFYLIDDAYFKGGYRAVADIAARDAIAAASRKEGMLVYTVADGSTWILGAGLLNTDWALSDPNGVATAFRNNFLLMGG